MRPSMNCGPRRGTAKDWIAKLQQDEIERTGIRSLKVRFNSVFGYYIEVTRSNLDKVPPHYVRKQTIANGERFITPELKEMEGKILGAEERSVKLEYELFLQVREEASRPIAARSNSTAAALAQLDVLAVSPKRRVSTAIAARQCATKACCTFAMAAIRCWNRALTEERFVPNDTAASMHAETSRCPDHRARTWRAKAPTFARSRCWRLLAHTGSFIPGGGGANRSGRPHLHPHRRQRRPRPRPIDVHGGNERDGEHPQQRHRAQPDHPG